MPGTAVPFVLASRSIVRQEVSLRNRVQPITATSEWTKRPATLIRISNATGSIDFGMCSPGWRPCHLPPATAAGDAERDRTTSSPQVIEYAADDRRPL